LGVDPAEANELISDLASNCGYAPNPAKDHQDLTPGEMSLRATPHCRDNMFTVSRQKGASSP